MPSGQRPENLVRLGLELLAIEEGAASGEVPTVGDGGSVRYAAGGAGGGAPTLAAVYFTGGGTLNVPDGDLVKVPFNAVQADPASWWHAASFSWRMPAGTYLLIGQVWWDATFMDGTGYVGLEMLGQGGGSLPGWGFGPDNQIPTSQGEQLRQQVMLPLRLDVADETGVSLFAVQNAQNDETRTITKTQCWFMAYGWPD